MSQSPTDPASPYSSPPAAPFSPAYGAYEPAQPITGAPNYNPYPPQQYAPPAYYAAPPAYDPYGRPYSDKNKLVAGLLGIVLGGFGVGRFYTGHTGLGVAQLLVTLFTCGLGHFWGLIDGVMILVNGGTDAQGRILRER
jgi:TM2 domain-containing membrane protein YozV